MCGHQWLSSQMINLMATFMAQFVQMISYCAQGCILEFQIIVAKLDQINFLKYQAIFNAQLTKWLGVKSFDPPLVKKTNFRRFSSKRVKFELQLPYSLLFIFSKNHFQVHKYLFKQRNTKKIPRFNHQLGMIMPAALTAF